MPRTKGAVVEAAAPATMSPLAQFAAIENERIELASIPTTRRTPAQAQRFASLSREASTLRKRLYP